MNTFGAPLCAVLLTTSIASPARATEQYAASASTSLRVDGDEFVQSYRIACDATDASSTARLTTTGRDLRLLSAPSPPLVSGVDSVDHVVDEVVDAEWRAAIVPGARVFARITARCGSDDVYDEVVVDSDVVVTAPELRAPARLQRTDDLRGIDGQRVPVGVEVELIGLEVIASPRGEESVFVDVVGAGIDERFEIAARDIDRGRTAFTPSFTPTTTGTISITARFFDVASAPITLTAVVDDGSADTGDAGEGEGDVAIAGSADGGCSAVGGVAIPLALVVLGRRRRRRGR